ncbi:MAG: hypothetical protein ACXVEF_17390 [Polyangiales bacterium]
MNDQCPRDLGVVTCYFNPCGFRGRAENFERFIEPIRAAGLPLVVVEALFPGDSFALPEKHQTLKVKARDVMWQKERLLDLGVAWLPSHCTKVAWLDADVLFERDDWAVETSRLLDTFAVVQPFEKAVRLSQGAVSAREGDDTFDSFGAVFSRTPEVLKLGKFEKHGHTGFAWAARRDILARQGLYDACIAGSGDHMMAHAFAGDWESRCISRIVGRGGRHLAHFRRWSRKVHEEVNAQVSFTPGRILSLWHGTIENRRYVQRNQELFDLAFDPKEDIRISDTGCWEWSSDKPELHEWARRYFVERREDD